MTDEIPLLPVWSNVKASYRLAWENRGEYFKIARWWALVMIPVEYVQCSMVKRIRDDILLHTQDSAQMFSDLTHSTLLVFPISILIFLLCAPIAVAWHRLILRGEKVTVTHYLRFDHVVLSYFMIVLLLRVAAFIPSMLQIQMMNHPEDFPKSLALLCIILYIATLLFAVRVSIILPAKALQIPVTIKQGWQRTSWNFWRITWGSFLCAVPMFIVFALIEIIGMFIVGIFGGVLLVLAGGKPHLNEALQSFLGALNATALIIVALPVGLTFLSLSYRHFFEEHQPL